MTTEVSVEERAAIEPQAAEQLPAEPSPDNELPAELPPIEQPPGQPLTEQAATEISQLPTEEMPVDPGPSVSPESSGSKADAKRTSVNLSKTNSLGTKNKAKSKAKSKATAINGARQKEKNGFGSESTQETPGQDPACESPQLCRSETLPPPHWAMGDTCSNVEKPDAEKVEVKVKKGIISMENLDSKSPILVDDRQDGINPCILVLMACGIALPNVMLVDGLSQMGAGIKVYDTFASGSYDKLGSGIIAGCSFLGCFLYVLDWVNWGRGMQLFTASTVWIILCLACVLKCRSYPSAPGVMLMFNVAVLCGVLRKTCGASMRRASFYMLFTVVSFLTAAIISIRWAAWILEDNLWNESNLQRWALDAPNIYQKIYKERPLDVLLDCGANRTTYFDAQGYSIDVRADIGMACKKAHTVLFTVWANPLIATISCTFMGSFALMNGVLITLHGVDDMQKLERLLKRFLGLFVFTLMGMYLSVSVSGASLKLGDTLMAFFAAGLAAVCVWTWMELGQTNVKDRLKNSKMTELLLKAYTSDWGRAFLIGGFNVLLPCYLVLNMLKHKVRMASGSTAKKSEEEKSDKFTPWGRKLVNELQSWNWASILVKICILGELFFTLQVGVAKATYIFLSWLNKTLASVDYAVVVFIIFCVGYIMFLLPPVPGVPVYVFCGIVVAEQGRKIEGIGVFGGCAIACALSFFLKLAACTGQWGIGFAMGKSVKIQQLIGVDKVPTRAIEKILSVKGLSVGKVAVLVGGPDWPTSVTCGILKLNIPQMLIGTAPVFFVASPCVLAGAFMARVVPGEDSIYNALAGAFILLSGMAQMGAMLLAVSCITKTIEQFGDELAQPRPEHEVVAKLTAAEAEMVRVYREVTSWRSMGRFHKLMISTAAGLMLLSGFIFATGGEYCFRTFALSSDIDKPYEENGLNGKPHKIVLPAGWAAMALFAVGVFLHIVFVKVMTRMARKRLAVAQSPSSVEEGRPGSDVIGARLLDERGDENCETRQQ